MSKSTAMNIKYVHSHNLNECMWTVMKFVIKLHKVI